MFGLLLRRKSWREIENFRIHLLFGKENKCEKHTKEILRKEQAIFYLHIFCPHMEKKFKMGEEKTD